MRSGTTLMLEDSNNIDHYAGALAASGLRFLFGERAYDRVGTSIGDPGPLTIDRALGQKHMETIERNFRDWDGKANGRVHICISAWAPDMCSPELLKDLSALQKKLDTRITIHLNQIWGEVAAIKAHYNRLPSEYLADLDFLNDKVICAHARCMTPEEEKILGKARVNVSFNAAIAARRGLSPRIADLESYGCNVGMGSDNMAEDMVEVLRTGLFMERVRREDGRSPTPEQALRWATRNGYRALGVPNAGWLEAGNKADMIVIDLQRAHLVPMLRAVSNFVHNGQARDVEGVMVDGKWTMRDGKVLTMDEPGIVARAQKTANECWSRLFRKRFDLKIPAGFSPHALP